MPVKYRSEVPGLRRIASRPFERISSRAFSWRSLRSGMLIGLGSPFKDLSLAIAGGRGLQSRENSSAGPRLESAATPAAVVVDCKKRRRESMEIPEIERRTLLHVGENSRWRTLVGSWVSGGTLQSPCVTNRVSSFSM